MKAEGGRGKKKQGRKGEREKGRRGEGGRRKAEGGGGKAEGGSGKDEGGEPALTPGPSPEYGELAALTPAPIPYEMGEKSKRLDPPGCDASAATARRWEQKKNRDCP